MQKIIADRRERDRFFKFAIVGATGALIDFCVFNILVNSITIAPVWASVVSFSVAVGSNFLWNRYWTYPDSRSKPVYNQLFQFTIISIFGLIIRTPLFAALEKPLPLFIESLNLPNIPILDARFLGHNLALAIAIIVVMFWNFFINRYLTYSDVI